MSNSDLSWASNESSSGWRPIETAPKDGTEVLAWREDAGVMLAQWCCPQDFLSDDEQERELGDMEGEDRDALERAFEQEDWFAVFLPEGSERLEGDLVPTHWMPLPPSP